MAIISVSAGYGIDGSSTPTIVDRAIAELDRLAEQRFVAVERLGPEAMRQHRHARRLRAIIGGIEQPSAHRPQAHHAEERAADHAGLDHARLAEADQREVERREVTERRDGLDARRRSRISGTEKLAFSLPRPGALWRM